MMLFDIPAKLLNRPPRVLMHLADAGYIDGTGDVVQWWCSRCGHETDWQPEPTTRARPAVQADGKGRGIQITRVLPMSDKRPLVQQGGGSGVQAQRQEVASGTGRIAAPFP